MNKNNRRSSLRKAPNNEEDTTTTGIRIKRRISFSGKKSVREFINTEEPKNWNHSYEVSDHISAEDNSGSGSGPGTQALSGEDKENISLPATSVCERSHIDITLNLQTSVDVTLLPCELSRKKQKPLDAVRDSLALTLEERQGLRDPLYDHRIMDKTLDVMSGSLVTRLQKSVLHNASGGELAPLGKREITIHTTANCMRDSFMDITPLAPSPAAPAPAAPVSQHLTQQSNMQLDPKDIELDMFTDQQNLMANKENVCPAQKSVFMELEEKEAVKPVNNKTQYEDVDISFATSLNVSADRDLLPPGNISFESASSGNSTINFKDESVLIPLDMISGKRISKKINLRQLNDELEAGKIQLFPNGPKTPTTDRNSQKRYWHGLGLDGLDMEEGCPPRDIKSSIKPRGMLNFSESMAISPPPMAPPPKEIRDKAKDKEKDKDTDDKRKYRLSQADEIMLDNTNFLAHARLGDETQSRNTSKNSTRRETTYDYSELDLERPASRQNFHHPMPSLRPRQSIHHPEEIEADQSVSLSVIPAVKTIAPPPLRRTIHQPVEMEADQSESISAIPAVKTTAPPPRRTIHQLEEMEADQSVSLSAFPAEKSTAPPPRRTIHQLEEMEADQSVSLSPIPAVKTTAPPPPRRTIHHLEEMEADQSVSFSVIPAVKTTAPPQGLEIKDLRPEEVRKEVTAPAYTRIKTKRRETLLMQVSMEEEIIHLPMELQSDEKINSKPRHTLYLAEDLENTNLVNPVQGSPLKISVPPGNPPKLGQNVVIDEPMEKEIDFSMKNPPDDLQMIHKSRQTLDMEEDMHPNSKEPSTLHPSHKSRRTIIMSEAIEEDKSILQPSEPSLQKYKALEAPHRPRTRQTLLLAEPIEEDHLAAFKSNIPIRESSRSKPRNTILMAEPILEDLGCKPVERQQKSESMQLTLVGSERISNTESQISSQHMGKKIHMSKPEEIYQDMDLESPASSRIMEQHPENDMRSTKPRKTIIKPEPIEEIEIIRHSEEQSLPKLPPYLEEPIKGEVRSNVYQSLKHRKTIIKTEPIEEEALLPKHNTTEVSSVPYRQQKSRLTLVKAEPMEEDEAISFKPNHIPSQEEHPRPKSRNTILVDEEIFEDSSLKSMNKPVSLDHQSPQETVPKPNLQLITPKRNPRLTSLYKDLGNFTPGMSLTEFEDQEEMCKTPRPKPKQRQRSIYHPAKMETSVIGTPVNQANQKRLPKHLTPNLPESKKRHTQLFANCQMDMDMVDMEDGAWEGANIALEGEAETHKFLPSFRINHFDETVQPVRDYHPSLTQLGHVSSLEDVLQLPQSSELDEKPITISDVTNYFLKEKQEEQRKSSGRESGSSADRTFKSYAVAHTKFINLSGDTTIFAGAIDVDAAEEEEDEMEQQNQIDNERISLVSTLAEETVENEQVEEANHQPELCQSQITPAVIAGSTASCRKCGNCNRSLSETRRSTDSFVLPQLSLFEFTKDRQRLRRQRLKPSFEEMQKHWQVKSQETELNESLDETKAEERLFHWDKAKLMQRLKRPKSRRNRDKALAETKESFFDRLDRLLADQQPNWIFDFQLKASRQLIFYHRLLTTFCIVVNYYVLDEQDESAIRVCSVAEGKAVAGGPPERWTTFEHYLNFQLSLKMPLNLTDALGGSDEESFRKFLQRIDQIVVGIKRTFHKLMTVLTAANVRLLRQSNRIFVRKTVVKCIEDEPLVRFERTHFVVQIANVEEICFTDILQPELYLFNENLQFLPKGIAFLEAFLPNPEQYLRTSN